MTGSNRQAWRVQFVASSAIEAIVYRPDERAVLGHLDALDLSTNERIEMLNGCDDGDVGVAQAA